MHFSIKMAIENPFKKTMLRHKKLSEFKLKKFENSKGIVELSTRFFTVIFRNKAVPARAAKNKTKAAGLKLAFLMFTSTHL